MRFLQIGRITLYFPQIRQRKLKFGFGLLLIIFFNGTFISANEGATAKIIRQKEADKNIAGLVFNQELKLQVLTGEECRNILAPNGVYCIELEGQYTSRDAILSVYNKRGRISLSSKKAPKTRFKVKVPVTGKSGWIQFLEINAKGHKKVENIRILASGLEGTSKRAKPSERGSRMEHISYKSQLGVGTSFSNIVYKQTGKTTAADTTLNTLTVKLDYRRKLGKEGETSRYSLGMNVFGNAFPITTSRTDTVNVRFIGANWRFSGYILSPEKPFNIEWSAGGYYHTMLVTNKAFGFEHAAGPQLLTRLKYDFSPSQGAYTYGKWAILPQGWIPKKFSDAEYAVGLGYHFLLLSRHSIVFSFDFARLSYAIGNITLTSQSLSGGMGYSFGF